MQLAIPRYSQKGFPKYRYLPNANSHREIQLENHFLNKKERELPFLPPEKWMSNESYLYGVDLFNHGYWWEAHEAWEAVWLTTEKVDLYGQLLQSLIQFSAALFKLYSGDRRNFDRLYQKGMEQLKFCIGELSSQHRKHFLGLNLGEWASRMETFWESVSDPEDEIQDPLKFASFPAILLEDKTTSS